MDLIFIKLVIGAFRCHLNSSQIGHQKIEAFKIMTLWKTLAKENSAKKYLFVLINKWHFHVLARRSHQLATLWGGSGCLLFVSTHTDQEEKAGDNQRNGYAGNQDVENPHFAVVTWAW